MSLGPEPPAPYRSPFEGPEHEGPRAVEGRAVLALVLGALSLLTFGVTGIPAIALGVKARNAIQRSGGMLRGDGLATLGIASGLSGTVFALMGAGAMIASLAMSSHGGATFRPIFAPSPGTTTAWTAAAPSLPSPGPTAVGMIRVIDLDPDVKRTFHQQLADEYRRASMSHETVVVMTSARWCSVCKEFEAALRDARMQSALAHVALVRADVDDFDDELKAAGMLEDSLPWFYKIDSTLRPIDAISAGEWDENVPENMAPVLGSFLAGKLRARRDPSGLGTAL